jgi:hypothetical protein
MRKKAGRQVFAPASEVKFLSHTNGYSTIALLAKGIRVP